MASVASRGFATRLERTVPTALATLALLLTEAAPPAVRLRAALGTLSAARTSRSDTKLEATLGLIEELCANRTEGGNS